MNASTIPNVPHIAAIDRDTQHRACPRCKGTAVRIRRRAIDRLVSHFTTVYRYQCLSLHCGWIGNLRPDNTHAKHPAHAASE